MTATLIPEALDVAEAVILAALRTLGEAWWSGRMPAGTAGRLSAPPSEVDYLVRYWIAQHQDAGGGLAPRVGSAGWEGEVVVTCYSGDDERAGDGRTLAHAALMTMARPEGYGLQVKYLQPIARPNPDPDGIYGRASAYRITLRRS